MVPTLLANLNRWHIEKEEGKMEQKAVNRYYRKVIKALNECEIRFSKRPFIKGRGGKQVGVGGWYRDGVITVRNSPKTCNMLLYLIHEALHHLFPEIPEYGGGDEAIDLLSEKLFCEFSTKQLRSLEVYLPDGGRRKKKKK